MWRRDVLERARAEGAELSLTELASAHAALGNRARAYDLLAEALDPGESRLLALPSDPVWDQLRRDDRFREIEQHIRRARNGHVASHSHRHRHATGSPDPSDGQLRFDLANRGSAAHSSLSRRVPHAGAEVVT